MIPLRDENPSRHIPFVNLFLILLNVGVFVYIFFISPRGPAPFIERFAFVPCRFARLSESGWNTAVAVSATMVTSMFLHGGPVHLLGNMLYLWIFGDNIEDVTGHRRYLLFYLACGICGAAVQAAVMPESALPMVGASGCVAGVLGAYMVRFPRARVKTLFILFFFIKIFRIPSVLLLGWWIAIQVISSLADTGVDNGGVAWFAHMGGFAAGTVLIFFMTPRRKKR